MENLFSSYSNIKIKFLKAEQLNKVKRTTSYMIMKALGSSDFSYTKIFVLEVLIKMPDSPII